MGLGSIEKVVCMQITCPSYNTVIPLEAIQGYM